MYSKAFCKIYNEFGWNYFPEIFGEQLLQWIGENDLKVETSMDLACGTGILCEILSKNGINAAGMDFSEGMIEIAKNSNPKIDYEVADMITFCPDKEYDLVTCTGDAINHIADIENVGKIFKNVYRYLRSGAWFVFDLLNRNEISSEEPFEMQYDDNVKAELQMLSDEQSHVTLQIRVFERGVLQFEEQIKEVYHEPQQILALLKEAGFVRLRCENHLLENTGLHGTTWFVTAMKP